MSLENPCVLCGATWGDVRREIEAQTYHFC